MAVRVIDDYREIVVPIRGPAACGEGMTIACRLAADHGARVTALTVIEVPAEFPLEAQMPVEEDAARRALAEARARAELYGVTVRMRAIHARSAAEAIVACAVDTGAQLIVLGASRRRRRAPVFGRTVGSVLAQAPCRVLVSAR